MADPAPSAPLPDAAPERRVSPADQMAALTGEPVEISRPEDDEPAEDRDDASQDRQTDAPFEDGALRATAPDRCALVSRSPKTRSIADKPKSADAPVSPPAPSGAAPSSKPDRNPAAPQPTPPRFPNRRWLLLPESPGPSERGLAKPPGRGAAERGGDGRRSPDRRSPSPRASCPGRSRRDSKAATSNAAASSDARAPTPSLLDRLAVKSILDNLRRPGGKGSRASDGARRGATAAASAAASAAPDATAKAVFACRRSPRQAWRLHRRPHASPARRR